MFGVECNDYLEVKESIRGGLNPVVTVSAVTLVDPNALLGQL